MLFLLYVMLILGQLFVGVKDVRKSFGWMQNLYASSRAYHMVGLPPARPGVRPMALQLYIYHGHELDNRKHLDVAKDLQCGTVERLQCMLHSYNPFVQCFKAMNIPEFGPNVDIVLHADVGMYFNASICTLDLI